MSSSDNGSNTNKHQTPIAWEALEDAFENNSPEVHSYLQIETGEVIRIVDGVADPVMHQRIMSDSKYLRVDPVSSRDQYRWMEKFIEYVEDGPLRDKLQGAIDGKGAFRRYKDILMHYPVERERWFTFRSERLRGCMQSWLTNHGIEPMPRPDVIAQSPSSEERSASNDVPPTKSSSRDSELRAKISHYTEALSETQLQEVVTFLEFLHAKKR